MLKNKKTRNCYEYPEINSAQLLGIENLEESNLLEVSDTKIKEQQIEDRQLYLTGEITQNSVQTLIEKIRYLNSLSAEPITLYINSEGGSVYDGFALCDVIKSSQSPIMGYVQGACMSTAMAVFASCVDRVCGEYAQFMVHSCRAEFGEMEQKDLTTHLAQISQLNSQMTSILCKASDRSQEYWLERINFGDYFFTSEEAELVGLVDEIM